MSEPTEEPRHPYQPMVVSEHGTYRFKSNEIVSYLLDNGGYDMNALAMMKFLPEDRAQFAQLIGYSLGGYSDLGYTDELDVAAAELAYVNEMDPKDAMIMALRTKLDNVLKSLADTAEVAFNTCASDTTGKKIHYQLVPKSRKASWKWGKVAS